MRFVSRRVSPRFIALTSIDAKQKTGGIITKGKLTSLTYRKVAPAR